MRLFLGKLIAELAQRREDDITAKMLENIQNLDMENPEDEKLYRYYYKQYWKKINFGLTEEEHNEVMDKVKDKLFELNLGSKNKLDSWWSQSRYYIYIVEKKICKFFGL